MSEPRQAFGVRRVDVEPSEVFVLRPGVNRLGARRGNDVVLDVPGVSRLHCEVHVGADEVRLIDLASKNGVTVNGVPHSQGRIELGDEIQLGEVVLRLEPARVEDIELGIRLSSQRDATPSRRDATLSPGTRGATREQASRWNADPWRVVGRVAEVLMGPHPGRVSRAIEKLVAQPGVEGAAWLELPEVGSPVLLASSGVVEGTLEVEDSPTPGELQISDVAASPAWVQLSQRSPLGGTVGLLRLQGPGVAELDPEVLRVLTRLLTLALDSAGQGDGNADDSVPESRPANGLAVLPGHVVGSSNTAQAMEAELGRVAATEIPLLILGETGVGKERIARRIHRSSRRSEGPFVAVNCAAIPEHLAEAELFGIGRGVATGVEERAGQFALAEGGTLLLDEVGELPRAVQIKLLRALQEREVQPLGRVPIPVDVRVLAATNADLLAGVETGDFRADLYYRLAGAVIEVPTLRQRREDIPALVESFVRRFGREARKSIRGVTLEALDLLGRFPWPGNIRELENEVRRLVLRTPSGQPIRAADLSPEILDAARGDVGTQTHDETALPFDLATLERRAIARALAETDGNQAQAARLLGISRYALRRRIEH